MASSSFMRLACCGGRQLTTTNVGLVNRRFPLTTIITKRCNSSSSASGGNSTIPQPRKKVSLTERSELRAARRERATRILQQQRNQQQGTTSTSAGEGASSSSTTTASSAVGGTTTRLRLLSRYMWPIGLGVPTILIVWGLSDDKSPPATISKMMGLTGLISSIREYFSKPVHDKLLPDWSIIPNVPHDMPPPHTLVLDLENTLVSSTWDRKHGWRHAKRPGVDKFLMDMAQYYEIVLYSPSMEGVADPVVTALDKSGCIMHRLYRDATYYKNGIHMKDLNSLNRNVKRIIVLDDDPLEVSLFPDNVIRVKPYLDPTDMDDRTLQRITPFLIEIARENYQDIPTLLRPYRGMDADQIADEFDRRVLAYKQDRERHYQRGLAGLLGGGSGRAGGRDMPAPELPPVDPYYLTTGAAGASQQLTAKDLVGPAPTAGGRDYSSGGGGGLAGWLNRHNQDREEQQKRKLEKWNEVMQRRHREQEEAEKQKKKKEATTAATT